MDNKQYQQNKITKKPYIVIYIHGSNSNGCTPKTDLLKSEFEDILTPSFPISPYLTSDTLDQLINQFSQFYEKIILIGSSLGGYYALSFLNRYPEILKIVLINPAVHCERNMSKRLGRQIDFRNLVYELNESHVEELKSIKAEVIQEQVQKEKILLLIQKGDQVIDHNETLQFLPYAQTHIQDGGNHQYMNLEKDIPLIKQFILS